MMSQMSRLRLLGSATVLSVVLFVLLFFINPPQSHPLSTLLSHPDSKPHNVSPSSAIRTPLSPPSPVSTATPSPTPEPSTVVYANPSCAEFPDTSNIQVVVKTGSNIIYDKLPTQLLTALQCYTDLLLLADCEQDLGTYHVHDVLANVNETIKATHPDFTYYHTLQKYQNSGLDLRLLREDSNAAWNLDKYKFIHMLKQAWTRRPVRDWYIFIEADTYLVLSNLPRWLDRMDPSQPLYLGSAAFFNGESFGHGGSGIVLSRAAMAQVFDSDPGLTERYDQLIQKERFGDYVLMKALKEKGVMLQNAWPLIQGERVTTLPFGPGPDTGVRHWCQPLITMHHVTPGDVSAMWNFEQQRRNSSAPILMADIYEYFIGRDLPADREDWHNLSDDLIFRAPGVQGPRQMSPDEMNPVEKNAHRSFEDCRAACEQHARCYQYLHDSAQKTCGFSFSYRLGERRLADDNEHRYKSGWVREKIERDYQENMCKEPQWS